MVVICVVATILVCLGINAVILWNLRRRMAERTCVPATRPFEDVRFPCGLFLCENHSWARLADSGELRIGADELIAQALGGADRIELPRAGTEVRRGDPLVTVHRLGRKVVLRAPSSGTVVRVNEALKRNPASFAVDPYGIGWLVTLWPVEHTETLKYLRVGERATKWLEREIMRFTDLLARHTTPEAAKTVLADGARPIVGSALALDDSGWETFQREFFSTPGNEL